jgi:hypothetical protein
MKPNEIAEIYNKYQEGDYAFLDFELVENKRSTIPDLHGMLLFAEIFKPQHRIVSAAEHDQIWFNHGDLEEDENYNSIFPITEEQLLELFRCGFSFDEETESFFAFK